VSRFGKRWHLLLGLLLALVALIAGSEALVPHWLPHFLAGLTAYRHYTGAPSAFDAIFGRSWSAIPAALVFVTFAGVAWKSRFADVLTREYALALALALAVTIWAVPANFDPYNQLLSLPLVFLLGRMMAEKASVSRVITNPPEYGMRQLAAGPAFFFQYPILVPLVRLWEWRKSSAVRTAPANS
jgi:hypothetical protein